MARPAGQIAHQGLVDRGVIEGELLDLPGIGQLGGGDLVFDGPRFLLVDLGGQKISDDLAGFVLAAHSNRHEFVISGAHPVELQLAHCGHDVSTIHQLALRSRS